MSANNDELHKQAVALLERLKPIRAEAKAKSTLKDYNTRRREATAALKPVLTAIWEAFDRGETVGGCAGQKAYCKKYKKDGMLTYARCRQIITGKSGNEGKGSSHLTPIKVSLSGTTINVKAGFANQDINFESARQETYNAVDRKDPGDHSETPRKEDGTADWVHIVRELSGEASIRFELEDATDQQLAAGLLKKFKATLKTLHLWNEELTQEFNQEVAETIECETQYKERRSKRAKRAAETRKRNAHTSKTELTPAVLTSEQFDQNAGFVPGPPITIKMTEAQMREVDALHKGMEVLEYAYDLGSDRVGFQSWLYQEHAKKLVMSLQKRIEGHVTEYNSHFDEWTRADLLNWTNKSPEAIGAKKESARIHGAIRACEGAISGITYGDLNSDDPARSIREWWEDGQDAKMGITDQEQEELEA